MWQKTRTRILIPRIFNLLPLFSNNWVCVAMLCKTQESFVNLNNISKPLGDRLPYGLNVYHFALPYVLPAKMTRSSGANQCNVRNFTAVCALTLHWI